MKAAKEALPNPADMFQSLRYLQDQSRKGMFQGYGSAYSVMVHLTTNMWVRTPNNDGAGIGQVMYGRSSVEDIAASTSQSARSVQRALKWLADEGWLETERVYVSTGREDKRYIMLMLDHRAHVSRMRRQEAGEALDRIVREGDKVSPRGGDNLTPSVG